MGKLVVKGKAGRQRRYCSHSQYCLLVLLVPMIIFLLGAGALTTQAHTNLPQFLTKQTTTIPQQETYVLGETFKIGNLQYKINSVKTENTFLLLDLTIENQGNVDVEVRNTIGFKLKDQNGKKQNSSMGTTKAAQNAIGGTLIAGGTMSGQLAYEVFRGTQSFELTVIPNPLSSKTEIATVQITLP